MIGSAVDDASVSDSPFLRYGKWFRSFCKGATSSLALMALVTLGSAFFLLFPSSAMAMADNDRAIMPEQLKQLQTATSVVLMFVPEGMDFGIRVDEKRLPGVSCSYNIVSVPGPTSDEILRILNESILEYQEETRNTPRHQEGIRDKMEPRLGLIFRFANRLQHEFYFEDWGGRANAQGYSGKYRMLASADFPTRLRALVTHPDVVLIKDKGNACPHS